MSEEDDVFDDEIDPRIKGELDTLNQSTDEINKLETELNEYREKFKASLASATQQLQKLTKKYGKSIERARPYYETKAQVSQAQLALQRAVHNFQRANGVYRAAKETIALAESRLSELDDKKVDMAWQEMLNLQTIRFMDAERDRTRSESLHQRATKRFQFLDGKLQAHHRKHKNSTKKTKPYFELKELLEVDLQKKRQKVDELGRKVDSAKKRYRTALDSLEKISSEIHEKRRQNKSADALEMGIDEHRDKLFSNPMELDLVGRKTYDDIDQLEAELDEFSIDDEDDVLFSSGSESEDDVVESTPTSKQKNSELKRANTSLGFYPSPQITRKKHTRSAVKRPPPSIQRSISVNVKAKECGSKLLNDLKEGEESSIQDTNDMSDIKSIEEEKGNSNELVKSHDATTTNSDSGELDEATYRRLHGTNINQEKITAKHPKKHLEAPDDFDIFDELC